MPEVKKYSSYTIQMAICDECFPASKSSEMLREVGYDLWRKRRLDSIKPCFCTEDGSFLCEEHLLEALERLRDYQGELELQRDAELGHLMADLPDTQDLKRTGL